VRRFEILLLAAALAARAGAQPLPDLALDVARLGQNPLFDLKFAAPEDCTLQPADLCVGGPGTRKLLRFDVLAVNVGLADLVLGVPDSGVLLPDGDPMWVFSACHGHYHFQSFARYELRGRGQTTPIVTGAKRSFCVEDTQRVTATTERRYCCNASCGQVQGVQVGWGDLYASNLDCQWIDLTDGVPPGDYDLCVFLNTAGILPDANPANDLGCVPVTLSAPSPDAPAPRVRVTAPRRHHGGRAGRPLKIAWKKRVRGAFRFQEVWASLDDGATWTLVSGELPAGKRSFRWLVPEGSATDAARVRVVVWARNPRDDPVLRRLPLRHRHGVPPERQAAGADVPADGRRPDGERGRRGASHRRQQERRAVLRRAGRVGRLQDHLRPRPQRHVCAVRHPDRDPEPDRAPRLPERPLRREAGRHRVPAEGVRRHRNRLRAVPPRRPRRRRHAARGSGHARRACRRRRALTSGTRSQRWRCAVRGPGAPSPLRVLGSTRAA
jgi:hypothetical protein